jgi:hypothetical protein
MVGAVGETGSSRRGQLLLPSAAGDRLSLPASQPLYLSLSDVTSGALEDEMTEYPDRELSFKIDMAGTACV